MIVRRTDLPSRAEATTASAKPLRLSVVVPAYQEERPLRATVQDLCTVLRDEFGSDFEIIVVDDGSRDGTFDAALAAADGCDRCRVVSYARNLGKGHALRRGFASARGRQVAFVDADGEIAARTLMDLVRGLQHDVSATVGRRRWEVNRPWYRRAASACLASFARLAFDVPVPETQAGVKVFVRDDVADLVAECREDRYLFDLELLARMRRADLRMRSVDIVQTRTRTCRIGFLEGMREVGAAWRIWRDLRVRREARVARPAARALVPLREDRAP